MRDIIRNLQLTIDGKSFDFRLKKLDAFSGVSLLRMLIRLEGEPPATASGRNFAGGEVNRSKRAPQCGVAPTEVAADGKRSQGSTLLDLITSLSEEELRSVMTSCLNHTEVMLPAGPQPVMTGHEWGWPELEHDTISCLKLTVESISWSLSGFFGEGGSASPPEPPAISP